MQKDDKISEDFPPQDRESGLRNSVSQSPREKFGFFSRPLENVNLFVAQMAFFQGLFALNQLAVFMYQKKTLGMEPSEIQFATGLIAIPWSLKPIYGYFIDKFLKKYRTTKPIFVNTSFVMIIMFSFISHFTIPNWMFYLIYFVVTNCIVCQNIVAEYLLCVTTQKESRETGVLKNNFPIFFGFRAVGGLIGTFFSGRIIKAYSINAVFYISSFIPALIIIFSLIHQEQEHTKETQERSFKDELRSIGRLLSQKELSILITCVCLLNICPNFDSITTFYLSEVHKFSTKDLADLSTVSAMFYIIGLAFYYKLLLNVSPKKLFLSTNFLLWIGNFSFIALVLRWIESWGISPLIFCMFNYGITSFINELNSMPVMAIWTAYVPEGLEATSITLLTGINNLSNNISNYTGSFVAWIFGVSSKNLERFSLALIVQNIYLILIVLMLFCVPIAEPKMTLLKSTKSYEMISIDSKSFEKHKV